MVPNSPELSGTTMSPTMSTLIDSSARPSTYATGNCFSMCPGSGRLSTRASHRRIALNPSTGTLLLPVSWNPGAEYFTYLDD